MHRLDIHYSDGRTVPVTITKDEMLIGRDASCDVMLEDAITSRHHARLTCDEGGQYWIQDLQSKNGTTGVPSASPPPTSNCLGPTGATPYRSPQT